MKRVWVFLPLLVASLYGQVVDYGFDGDLSSILVESSQTDNTFPLEQVAGRLIYHNNGSIAPDSTTLMELATVKPVKNASWSLPVEVTVSNRLSDRSPFQGGHRCGRLVH